MRVLTGWRWNLSPRLIAGRVCLGSDLWPFRSRGEWSFLWWMPEAVSKRLHGPPDGAAGRRPVALEGHCVLTFSWSVHHLWHPIPVDDARLRVGNNKVKRLNAAKETLIPQRGARSGRLPVVVAPVSQHRRSSCVDRQHDSSPCKHASYIYNSVT